MEATLPRLVDVKELKTNLWKQAAASKIAPSFYFDPKVDAVMLLIVEKKTPKIVLYIDEHVALLYQPESKEIIGLRIENFQKSFLPKYAELQQNWKLSSTYPVRDFGDLIIRVRKQEGIVAKQISSLARPAAAKVGMDLAVFV